jgi:hypothetical protein
LRTFDGVFLAPQDRFDMDQPQRTAALATKRASGSGGRAANAVPKVVSWQSPPRRNLGQSPIRPLIRIKCGPKG